MFTRLQLYILIGCILVAASIFAVWEFWPKPASQPSDSSMPVSATSVEKAQDVNDSPTATEAHQMLPETPLPDPYFKLAVNSHTDIEQSTGDQKIDADLELKYTHQKTADGIILTLYSMGLNMYQDGVFVEGTIMTRDKFVQKEGSQKMESSFDELSPEQQEMFAASFATNLCKIILDTNQNELGRQILSEDGLAMLTEGNVNSLRLMHGPYHHGIDRWQGVKRIPMTYGLIMDCPIEYARIKDSGDEINVNGSFTKDEVDSPQADVAVKEVSCTLSGKETFDENIGEYTTGELTLQYKFQIFQKGVQIGTMDGKMELSLEQVKTKGK
jgi:hypothetical protein